MKVIFKNSELVFQSREKVYSVDFNGGYAHSSSFVLSSNDAMVIDFNTPDESTIIADGESIQGVVFNGGLSGTDKTKVIFIGRKNGYSSLSVSIKGGAVNKVLDYAVKSSTRYRLFISNVGYCSIMNVDTLEVKDYDFTSSVGANNDNDFVLGYNRTNNPLLYHGTYNALYVKHNVLSYNKSMLTNPTDNSDIKFYAKNVSATGQIWTSTDKSAVLNLTEKPILHVH